LPTEYPAGPHGTPLFALDVENATMGGLDNAAWGQFSAPE
jgi:hypothetical protein